MNLPLLSHLVNFIEELFKTEAPVITKAAAAGAVAAAEEDPKVQAVVTATTALLEASQTLKDAIAEHPDAQKP